MWATLSPSLCSFSIMTQRAFLFLLQWRNKLKSRIEHFYGQSCSQSDEKRRSEARKQDEGGIYLSKPKKAGKSRRDWCPLARTLMKNSGSTRGVMCSRCRTEVTNCDESILFRPLLCCQDNRTFLKVLSILKRKIYNNVCLSHIIWYTFKYILKLYVVLLPMLPILLCIIIYWI